MVRGQPTGFPAPFAEVDIPILDPPDIPFSPRARIRFQSRPKLPAAASVTNRYVLNLIVVDGVLEKRCAMSIAGPIGRCRSQGWWTECPRAHTDLQVEVSDGGIGRQR